MKIYNQAKTTELNRDDLDFEKGQLMPDKIAVHHEAVAGKTVADQVAELQSQGATVEEIVGKQYLVKAVYENGGKDVEEIEEIPSKEAYDEYEEIQVYVPYTEEELTERAERKELTFLEKWFAEVYDVQVKQYDRCQRLGIEYDNKYGTIAELDEQAVTNAKRISEMRNKYQAE